MTVSAELQKKSEKELLQILLGKRRELWDFRFGVSGSKVHNVKLGRQLRREIARLLTVLKRSPDGLKSSS